MLLLLALGMCPALRIFFVGNVADCDSVQCLALVSSLESDRTHLLPEELQLANLMAEAVLVSLRLRSLSQQAPATFA